MAETIGVPLAFLIVWGVGGLGWYIVWYRRQPQTVKDRLRGRDRPNQSRGAAIGAIFVGLVSLAGWLGSPNRHDSPPRPLWAWVVPVLLLTIVWAVGLPAVQVWGRRKFGSDWPDSSGGMDAVKAAPPAVRRRYWVWTGAVVMAGALVMFGLVSLGLGT